MDGGVSGGGHLAVVVGRLAVADERAQLAGGGGCSDERRRQSPLAVPSWRDRAHRGHEAIVASPIAGDAPVPCCNASPS